MEYLAIPHYFYTFLESAVPEEASFVIAKKLILERLIYSPVISSVYFICYCGWKVKTTKQPKTVAITLLGSTDKQLEISYCYTTIKSEYGPTYVNLMGFFWTIYIANKRRQLQSKNKTK
ncbi:hypothetical protein NQ317_001316 [Molorchus minor]|uniref:Uncharacterized protein n=1 Tax=Molorchus minor TaxID=1323400 RepID=A0ABQ9JA20_9CUCU|nr:hypothetical protein NQ317_001316 [Molorchus minor]